MKKLMLATTAIAMAAALAGCGRTVDNTASTSSSPSTSSPAPTESITASSSSTPSSAESSAAAAPATSGNSAMGAGASGQSVYTSTCAMCHAAGVAGAPKIGDKDDWKPRIAQGKDKLYEHALKGFQGKKGQMPPKGGNTSLPDADVKAAVDYMAEQAK